MCLGIWDEYLWSGSLEEDKHQGYISFLVEGGNVFTLTRISIPSLIYVPLCSSLTMFLHWKCSCILHAYFVLCPSFQNLEKILIQQSGLNVKGSISFPFFYLLLHYVPLFAITIISIQSLLQNLKSGLTLWKFGTLPPALIAFRGHVHGIDPSWHLLGLGYQEKTDIDSVRRSAVIHYNGQCKPWLDIAFKNLQPFWARHVNYSNDFVRNCHILEPQYDKEWLSKYWTQWVIVHDSFVGWRGWLLLDMKILVTQESYRHWIQLTIPCIDRHANTWSFHLYHRGTHSFHLYHMGASFFSIL